MATRDDREHELTMAAMTRGQQHLDTLTTAGWPSWLAAAEASALAHRVSGIRFTPDYTDIPPAEQVADVRDLSLRYGLEHGGSALNVLLERYDYQWQDSAGTWHLTNHAQEERLGFFCPFWTARAPRILWKPAIVPAVIALEQARHAIEGLAPDRTSLRTRQYFSPKEIAQQLGGTSTTVAINRRLQALGYQAYRPHGRSKRWEPTPQALRGKLCIFGWRGLEWRPALLTEA